MNRVQLGGWRARLALGSGALLLAWQAWAAPTPVDEDAPWPRVRSTNGHTVTLHLPQVERWTSNSFTARAAVEVKPARTKTALLGVVWFEAHGSVDRSNRLVTLDHLEITRGNFPAAPEQGSNALAIVREVLPAGARTVSLDYLVTALGFVQAAARQGATGLKHDPPRILWVTNRTTLILIDGEPVLRPVAGTSLERVHNTPELLVRDKTSGRFYLAGTGWWFVAPGLNGPWSLAQDPPAEVAKLGGSIPKSAGESDQPPPRIIVSTTPAELLMTAGAPEYRAIPKIGLQYVIDSDNLIFFHTTNREAYLLLSGRWFKATSLHGPWTYVAPGDLPDNFARIPPSSPAAVVLASVPGTPQAELALLANSVPTTATVSRDEAKLDLTYDGEPKFKAIPGTDLSYALNARLPVLRLGERFYALDDGVWFEAAAATGPWQVASEVPEEIYAIPPSSPVYYATFARVYDSDTNHVEVGYTAGYTGAYEDEGTLVYGTGWDYEPWYGDDYYGWGWTWGYGYIYVPWYQWWVWRPWWNDMTGLRAALIENVYDRWGAGVTPHDRVAGAAANVPGRRASTGYPALYGRFRGADRPAALTPPGRTLALNPHARPPAPARAGEVPRGAQLLQTIRESPGGGRDLYASPDGNVYQRRSDGWYRRQAEGRWGFVAPAPSSVERRPAGAGGGGGAYRIAPGAGAQQRGNRVPQSGAATQARTVAALEQQYYARTVARMRAQNVRPNRSAARTAPARARRR